MNAVEHTSRCPVRPVLFTTWHKSGGPSSLKVAGTSNNGQSPRLDFGSTALTESLRSRSQRLPEVHLHHTLSANVQQGRRNGYLEYLWDVLERRISHA